MPRRTPVIALLVVITLLASGCGSDDESAAETTSTTADAATTTTVAATTTSTTTTEPGVLTITAVDFMFEGMPDEVTAGTRLRLVNESSAEFHEMVIFRLDDDETRSVEELRELEWASLILDLTRRPGDLKGVALAMPGEEQYEVVEGTTFASPPGRYIIFCSVPVGADPEQVREQVQFGPPAGIEGVPRHYEVGMMTEFTVVE